MITVEMTRYAFEERAFSEYYVRTIGINPNPRGMRLISNATMTKAELCASKMLKDGEIIYADPVIEQMWVGWKHAIEYVNKLAEEEL